MGIEDTSLEKYSVISESEMGEQLENVSKNEQYFNGPSDMLWVIYQYKIFGKLASPPRICLNRPVGLGLTSVATNSPGLRCAATVLAVLK